MQITKNFTDDEFKCPCCGIEKMDRDFVKKLQAARDIAGIAFKINSGWRCEKHNKAVGGVSSSSHLTGHAADIAADASNKRFVIVSALLDAGLVRIGVGDSFVHADDDNNKAQKVMWLY